MKIPTLSQRMRPGGPQRLAISRREIPDRVECAAARVVVVERTVDEAIEARHLSLTADRDQFHLARVARLEPDGRAGSDVEPHAVSALAIESQPAVHFEKMTMRSDLHRPIASIGDLNAAGRAAGVQLDWIVQEKVFAGDHRIGL